MATEALTFRISGAELEWLKSQQIEGESLNITAKRIFLETVKSNLDSKLDITLDSIEKVEEIKQELKTELLEIVKEIIEPIREVLLEDREKLERLANTVNDVVEKVSNYPDYTPLDTQLDSKLDTMLDTQVDDEVDTQYIDLEDKTVPELRDIAKALNIPYVTRTKKPELISLISSAKDKSTPQHHIQKTHKQP